MPGDWQVNRELAICPKAPTRPSTVQPTPQPSKSAKPSVKSLAQSEYISEPPEEEEEEEEEETVEEEEREFYIAFISGVSRGGFIGMFSMFGRTAAPQKGD